MIERVNSIMIIVRTFVNVTMYLQYNNNNISKKKQKKLIGIAKQRNQKHSKLCMRTFPKEKRRDY
jgi:hypothetical protein